MPFGDYVIFVDESGDHGLEKCDPDYPVFVLAFCVMEKNAYAGTISPRLKQLKFNHFGHDIVILHEHDIRKAKGPFTFMVNRERRQQFLQDLSDLVAGSPFAVIAVVIRKEKLKQQYAHPENPYHLAMEYGLERVALYLRGKQQVGKTTHVVFEGRGKQEDAQLELEFRRVCDRRKFDVPLEIIVADKKVNSCGLQLADLIARPIGLHVLRPDQPNRAWDLIELKIDRSTHGRIEGFGLKCFP